MEQEINTNTEKHYGGIVAIVIVIFLVTFIMLYGTTSKVTVIVPQKDIPIAGTIATVTEPLQKPPVETFVAEEVSKIVSTAKESVNTESNLSPVNFKSFVYNSSTGKAISVSGTCKDEYYSLLIFSSKDDYRTSAGSAKVNKTFPCVANRFTIEMNLRDINLASGDYYFFVADQGKTGMWYNPR